MASPEIETLTQALSRLPGLGPRSARRAVLHLLKRREGAMEPLLRALDVPARLVSVYAPGLVPMDFHAVVEALVDDRWLLVDATRLAPRREMVRIATGRDAADTAFLTNTLADVDLIELRVGAEAPELEPDDPNELVELS